MNPTSAADVDGWTSALDQIDADLDEASLAVARSDTHGAAAAIDVLVERTADLPPLPPLMAARAAEIVQRLDHLAAAVDAARAEVRRTLSVTARLAATDRAVPRYIDQRS